MEDQVATDEAETASELDVRGIRKPDKHPLIFATYRALAVGEHFVLINDHDPKHLQEQFEADYPGSYSWEYQNREPRDWQIRITKLAEAAPLRPPNDGLIQLEVITPDAD